MADLFQSVLSASLWGGVLTVIFLIIQRLFKNKLPHSWQYYIWIVVLLRLLVPVTIPVSLPVDTAVSVEVEPATGEGMNTNVLTDAEPDDSENIRSGAALLKGGGEVGGKPIIFKLYGIGKNVFADLFWIVWFIPAVTIFIFKIASYLLFIKKLQRNNLSVEAGERQIFESQLMRINFRGSVKLYKSGIAQMPFAIGLFKPAVVLPDKKFSDLQLTYIFRHELRHIVNGDIICKWFFEAVKCLHWFNPFVYIAASRASFYAEARCDASVLKDSSESDRKEYSLTIVEVLRLAASPKFSVHMSMGGNRADLKERIQSILRGYKKKTSLLVTVFIIILAFGIYIASSLTYKEAAPDFSSGGLSAKAPVVSEEVIPDEAIPASANILLTCVDAFGSADVIALAEFDSEANEIKVTSLPRDMYLRSQDTKLRSFISLASADMNQFQNELSSALGIDIDYCIRLDMEAFEKIVDAAGGLEMEIPEGGLYYTDPEQNLEIALKGGKQHLDGEKALQYVRYRTGSDYRTGYASGDLERISVQQRFISGLYEKLISGENIFEKLYVITAVLLENTETNMTPEIAAEYLKYAVKLDKDSLKINTVAGESQFIEGRGMYYVPEEEYRG